jgi:hypothetical protein
MYPQVLASRTAFIRDVVLPAAASGQDPSAAVLAHGRVTGPPTTVWDPAAGVVQVIDSTMYPGNPSCPFPASKASAAMRPSTGVAME